MRRRGLQRCWAVSALWLALLAGCASERQPVEWSPAEWLMGMRSAHRRADVALGSGDTEAARLALEGALQTPVPSAVAQADRRVVHQDLWFRMAQLGLAEQQPQVALSAAESGLALGRQTDLFTANLLIARGQALEATKRDSAAASSYHEALEINRELLRRALGSPDAEVP